MKQSSSTTGAGRFGLAIAMVLVSGGSFARAEDEEISLRVIGRYSTGIFLGAASEIGAYDPVSQRLFVTNTADVRVDILDLRDPRQPALLGTIDVAPIGTDPTHVEFANGYGVVTVKSGETMVPGKAVFFDTDGAILSMVTVGFGPDACVFTPDGQFLLVANEAEPNGDYTEDPEGSVSVISLPADISTITEDAVRTAGFSGYNDSVADLRAAGVRIFGPKVEVMPTQNEAGETVEETVVTPQGATVAQDLEPEALAVSSDSTTAWVTLQENNAFGVIDIASAQVTAIVPLGYKSHVLPPNRLDASDRDNGRDRNLWPLRGMFQPDWVKTFSVGDKTYLITANEGDARDYDGFSEELRGSNLALSGFLGITPGIQGNAVLGRVRTTSEPPTGKEVGAGPDGVDLYRDIYTYGARSFSIWDTAGKLVFDSGEMLEKITEDILKGDYNSNSEAQPSGDARSDDKGPEPEAIIVGEVAGKPYAFVGLERVGGVAVFDLSNPKAPVFVTYSNHRDFEVEFDLEACGDCEGDCEDDAIDECESCKVACEECAECPEGEDCTEACAKCTECGDTYATCEECTLDCPVIAADAAECFDDCFAENCPVAGEPGRDPLDLAPEGLVFIPASKAPAGYGDLLVVTNEVSGSTTIFEIVVNQAIDLSGAFWAGDTDLYSFSVGTISTTSRRTNAILRLEGVALPPSYVFTGEMLLGSDQSGIGVTFNATPTDYNRVRRWFDSAAKGRGKEFHLADAGQRDTGPFFGLPPFATFLPFEVRVSPGRYEVTILGVTHTATTTKSGSVGLWSMGADLKAWRNLRINGQAIPTVPAEPKSNP
jgi:hypothetical protein